MQDTFYTFFKTLYSTTKKTFCFNYRSVQRAESKAPNVTSWYFWSGPHREVVKEPRAWHNSQDPLWSQLTCSVYMLTDIGYCAGYCPHIARRQCSRGLKTQDMDSECSIQKYYHVTVGESLNCSAPQLPHSVHGTVARNSCRSNLAKNYTHLLHFLKLACAFCYSQWHLNQSGLCHLKAVAFQTMAEIHHDLFSLHTRLTMSWMEASPSVCSHNAGLPLSPERHSMSEK